LDNASNNDTFVTEVERALHKHGISFDKIERRIRSDIIIFSIISPASHFSSYRCFPHVVNLAVRAVLSALTDLSFATSDAPEYTPETTCRRDPIASIRALVRVASVICPCLFASR